MKCQQNLVKGENQRFPHQSILVIFMHLILGVLMGLAAMVLRGRGALNDISEIIFWTCYSILWAFSLIYSIQAMKKGGSQISK